MSYYPERIICLTEETTELLYLLGQEDRIVGISGFTKRPKQARQEKPIVSAFVDANIEKILNLKPDLVVGFSDIQSDIAKQLIQKGINVWINNQRSIAEIKSFKDPPDQVYLVMKVRKRIKYQCSKWMKK